MSDDGEYSMVMPFVNVTSKGGQFNDEAFAAGYEVGLLDELLGNTYTFGRVTRTIQEANRQQVDLLAMRHGWKVTFEESPVISGWVLAEFVRLPRES